MKLTDIQQSAIKDTNSLEEVAIIFRRSPRTIQRWRQKGLFPESGCNLWSRETLVDFIKGLQAPKKSIKACAENMMGR